MASRRRRSARRFARASPSRSRREHVAREAIRLDETEYDKVEMAAQIEQEMFEAAEALDFERAAALRDQLRELKELPELIVSSRTKKDVARKTRGRRKPSPDRNCPLPLSGRRRSSFSGWNHSMKKLDIKQVQPLIRMAMEEDLGRGDVTTNLSVPGRHAGQGDDRLARGDRRGGTAGREGDSAAVRRAAEDDRPTSETASRPTSATSWRRSKGPCAPCSASSG